MASSSTAAAYDPNNGGAGGKFRKKPFRKPHATPYDRPITAFRPNHNTNNVDYDDNGGWLSKIVNPTSKFITFGAHKIFSSLFRKRLLPPPPSQRNSGEGSEIKRMHPETTTTTTTNVDSATKSPADCGGKDCSGPSYTNGVAELEDILKQKTFTRFEIDQLTALISSRTSEDLHGADKRESEPKVSELQAIYAKSHNMSSVPAHENHNERVHHGDISTPEARSKVFPGDVASPAEIGKAYMASRSMEMFPSVLCLPNQLPKEISSTPYNPSAKSNSPSMYLTQKSVADIGSSRNGCMTPGFRGRSPIYSTARTPYARVHPVLSSKAAETNKSIFGSGYSFHNVTENNHYKKQALKRRSSVLENDIGLVGPIRRIRQKTNFLYPKAPCLPPSSSHQAAHVSSVLSNVSDVRSSVECSSQNRSIARELAVNNSPATGGRYVPSQSIKMAQKIFEALDQFSPKKSSNKKADVLPGTSPSKKLDQEGLDDLKRTLNRQDIIHNHPTETSLNVKEGYPKVDDVPSTESPTKSVAVPDIHRQEQFTVESPLVTKSTAQLGKSEFESVANCSSACEATVSFPSLSPSDVTVPGSISTPHSTPQSAKVDTQLGKSNIFTAVSCNSDNLSPSVCTQPSAAKNPNVEISMSANKVTAEGAPAKTVLNSTLVPDDAAAKCGDILSVDALSNGAHTNDTLLNGVLCTAPTTSASNATDYSCHQKSNVVCLSHTATTECIGGPVQTDGPATADKLVFPFQTGDTAASAFAPVSTLAPSFSGGLVGTSSSFSVFTSNSTAPSIFGFTNQSPKSTTFSLSESTGLSVGPINGCASANPLSSEPTTAPIAVDGRLFSSSLASTSSSVTPSIFGFTSQSAKPSTATALLSPSLLSPSTTFSFGLESTGATTTSSFTFGAPTNSSSVSNSAPFIFGDNSGVAASTPAVSVSQFEPQPAVSNASSQPFVSTPSMSGDQMITEETMTMDSLQQPAPPTFSAPLSAPSSGFVFNAAPTVGNILPFNTQQSSPLPQNSPFQPPSSVAFNGGTGSFSLGTTDKSQRRIIRVKKGPRRK